MTSSSLASATATETSTTDIITNNAMEYVDMDNNNDSHSATSSPSSTPSSPEFPRFNDLPAELRHQIWRDAIPPPGQGINFFNVHAFPNDHKGCNRSTSPPWVYLDLRRLDIDDDDDDVATYDPSSFQARSTVRAACREARTICAIPESKSAIITLTRPKDGLFIRAGDGQLRALTPFHLPSSATAPRDDDSSKNSPSQSPSQTQVVPVPIPVPVSLVRRKIEIHTDDILCLSIENCSFNLAHEENWFFERGYDVPDDEGEEGWAFDPQLMPPLPLSLRITRLCIGMARCNGKVVRAMAHTLYDLVYSHVPDQRHPMDNSTSGMDRLMHFPLFFDNIHGFPDHAERTPDPAVVWDRFGDRYLRLAWGIPRDPHGRPRVYRFVKMVPDKTDLRQRYIRSAVLHSPKRPARS
ncbi:hypothetical protein F5Y08DRAFT_285382 [Xylaria arbuscula]|nr:hypothetical protein F5Y08DRAFT_285382 [Xylaria arbuscula]